MGMYQDAGLVSSLEITNALILREYSGLKDSNFFNYYEKLDNDELLGYSIQVAWGRFYSIYINNRNQLDLNTGFNQENISRYMSFSVEMFASYKISFLSNLLRVLYEFNFWTGDLGPNGLLDDEYLLHLNDRFKDEIQIEAQFKWIKETLPIALTRWVLNSENFKSASGLLINIEEKKNGSLNEIALQTGANIHEITITGISSTKQVNDSYATIKKEIADGLTSIEESIKNMSGSLEEVNALERRVQDLRSEYNFVGLSSGFTKIKDKKEKELREVEISYKNLFGCLFIAPVLFALLHFFVPGVFPKDYTMIFASLPFVTVEMALIYFFRLSYLEAKSIRTQLVQIDLRLSLCSFIDGYVEYRKKNGMDIIKVLDSFDSLIFSPIQTNENNIPSMFDGLEAIAGVAERFTKAK
jgi:hypothetical protein